MINIIKNVKKFSKHGKPYIYKKTLGYFKEIALVQKYMQNVQTLIFLNWVKNDL